MKTHFLLFEKPFPPDSRRKYERKKKAKEKNPYDTALLECEDDDEKGRFVREARSNYERSNVGQ